MTDKLLDSGSTGASESFGAQGDRLPATFIATGLAGAETIKLQTSVDGGTTWADLYVEGSLQELSTTNTAITVYGPGLYRGNKASGSGELYVAYHRQL